MADYEAIHADVVAGTKTKDAVAKQQDATVAAYYSWRSKNGHSKASAPKEPKVTTIELPGLGISGPVLEIRGEPESLANFLVFLGRKLGGK